MNETIYDAVIIGGGPAGLNAALMLGRARKKAVVIDEGRPRNAVTREAHGFLTRDGIPPGELRQIAKEQIARYPGIAFVEEAAQSVAGTDGHFHVTTAGGSIFRSKKLLFAVGMKDQPLNVPGLSDVYGKSAFVCPYCDGWELRDEPLVIISKGADALHFIPLIAGWTNRFTLCTNGPDGLTEADREELRQHGVPLFDAPIRSIESEQGMVRQVVLEDGTAISCRGIFFRPDLVLGSPLPQTLGCQVSEAGTILVDEFGRTTVPGVFSAGDAITMRHQAIAAAASGAMTAAALNNELNIEAWRNQG
ncbi:NAD(P)/FAD-dependent oxidoreductase [Paenibacillus phocaensis]|uniref:NAD(P)/FAD-dependent oxidoreductase n=1 Tax=Paenibacillus phocaensis TaxID=1776378 RepID=UPI00039D4793|nr:NAD(P)/FAD-dependent oxidoreductase [Paenibacillus phocaensis]